MGPHIRYVAASRKGLLARDTCPPTTGHCRGCACGRESRQTSNHARTPACAPTAKDQSHTVYYDHNITLNLANREERLRQRLGWRPWEPPPAHRLRNVLSARIITLSLTNSVHTHLHQRGPSVITALLEIPMMMVEISIAHREDH